MFMWQKGGKEEIQEKKGKVSFFLHHDHNFLSQVQHILYISINNNKHINIFIFILFCVDALPLNQRKCVTFCWCCCCEWICDTIRTHIIITCILCVYTRRSGREGRKNRERRRTTTQSGVRSVRTRARTHARTRPCRDSETLTVFLVQSSLWISLSLFSTPPLRSSRSFRFTLTLLPAFAFLFVQFGFCRLIWH